MHKAQRRLILATLVAVALGFHFWHLRWRHESRQPWEGSAWPKWSFATFQWTTEPELPAYFEGWGGANDTKAMPLEVEWKEWGATMWRYYESERRPMAWMDYLRSRSRVSHWLGLWRTGYGEEDAWIWGVWTPVGFLALALFLALGWRKRKQEPNQSEA